MKVDTDTMQFEAVDNPAQAIYSARVIEEAAHPKNMRRMPDPDARGSMLTSMVRGRSMEAAGKISPEELMEALGGLPEAKHHCAKLTVNTLQEAITNWRHAASHTKASETISEWR